MNTPQSLQFPIVIKRSGALLVFRLVMIEVALELAYLAAHLGFDHVPSGVFIAVITLQVVALVWLLIHWVSVTYEIHQDEVVHRGGILFRKTYAYPYNNVQSLKVIQSPLGKMLHYGRVELYIPTLGQTLRFDEIPNPDAFAHMVRHAIPYAEKRQFIVGGVERGE